MCWFLFSEISLLLGRDVEPTKTGMDTDETAKIGVETGLWQPQ